MCPGARSHVGTQSEAPQQAVRCGSVPGPRQTLRLILQKNRVDQGDRRARPRSDYDWPSKTVGRKREIHQAMISLQGACSSMWTCVLQQPCDQGFRRSQTWTQQGRQYAPGGLPFPRKRLPRARRPNPDSTLGLRAGSRARQLLQAQSPRVLRAFSCEHRLRGARAAPRSRQGLDSPADPH